MLQPNLIGQWTPGNMQEMLGLCLTLWCWTCGRRQIIKNTHLKKVYRKSRGKVNGAEVDERAKIWYTDSSKMNSVVEAGVYKLRYRVTMVFG